MKNRYVLALILLASSGLVSAENNNSNENSSKTSHGLKTDERGNIDINYYMMNCNSIDNIGYSSTFGNYEDYIRPYADVGWLSAQLENVRGIKSSDVSYYKTEFKDSLNVQYTSYESIGNMRMGLDRNESVIDDDPVMYAAYKGLLEDQIIKIEDQIDYNTGWVIGKIKTQLSKTTSTKDGQIITSSWSKYKSCKKWWDYEQGL